MIRIVVAVALICAGLFQLAGVHHAAGPHYPRQCNGFTIYSGPCPAPVHFSPVP